MEEQRQLDFENDMETDFDQASSLPSRRDYHRGKQKEKRKKKIKSPFFVTHVLLAVFLVFVVSMFIYSITHYF